MIRVIKSFSFAFHGLKDCLLHEKNFKIQCLAAFLVVAAGFFFSLNSTEWLALLLCSAVVLSLEIINSAIEKLCNLVSPDFNLTIKKVKDMSAAAVLVSAIFSFLIGCLIFLPKLWTLFFR
jgi:diacylglycerol kinase